MTDFGGGGDLGELNGYIKGLRGEIAGLKSDIAGLTGGASGSSNILNQSLASFTNTMGKAGAVGNILGGLGTAVGGAAVGMSMMMPSLQGTMNQASNFYRATMFSGGGSRADLTRAVFSASGGYQSGPGAMAMAANYLGGRGVGMNNPSFAPMLSATANVSRLLNIDNTTAAQAVESMSSGGMSASLYANMGIYTSDPTTGRTRNVEDIFGSMANYFTAGQSRMSATEIQESFRKGRLGASLQNLGLDDTQKQMFLSYMVNRANGVKTNFSDNTAMDGVLSSAGLKGNNNPLSSTMSLYGTMSGLMSSAESSYIAGTDQGVAGLQGLDGVVQGLIGTFGALNAQVQTFMGNNVGQGMVTGATNVVAGMAQVTSGILGLFGRGAVNGTKNSLGTGSTSDTGGMSGSAPTNGPISASFGQKGPMWGEKGHQGTDYAVPDGTSVMAAAAGKVVSNSIGSGAHSYGKYVVIDHGNGYKTRYAHLQQANVYPGDTVEAGQVIAQSGHSGHVTGPHLHFEVLKNDVSVPPGNFLSGGAGSASGSNSSSKSSAAMSVAPEQNLFQITMSGVSAVAQSVSQMLGVSSQSPAPAPASYSPSSGATGVGGSLNGLSLASAVGASSHGGGGHGKVEINVHVASASEAEARRFAMIVKDYIEKDSLTSNMGRF